MPLKDYLCGSCGHEWEEFLLAYDDGPEACSHCEGTNLTALPSAPGGYKINGTNSASTTPKASGSKPRGSK